MAKQPSPSIRRHRIHTVRNTLVFYGVALLVLGLALGVFWGLMQTLGRQTDRDHLIFPPAFLISTLLLLGGSLGLHFAVRVVRRERQAAFRGWMIASLACAALFIGIQLYGLWAMFPSHRTAADASLGVTPFVFVPITLHAVHFFVATLFVCHVTVLAMTDRYDHEYFWGVRACGWLWHALGIIWLAILGIFAIVLNFG